MLERKVLTHDELQVHVEGGFVIVSMTYLVLDNGNTFRDYLRLAPASTEDQCIVDGLEGVAILKVERPAI